jgi:predicted RecA/RadA family phage recombinase
MATNLKYKPGGVFRTSNLMKATAEDARASNIALSGDPVVVGQIPGVALINADTGGKCTVAFDGVWEVLVGGKDSSGTSGADASVAVNGGDQIYFDKTKSPPLSKRAGGIKWGKVFADAGVEVVASGATTTKCNVMVGV